jgi:hypothetical protein
MGRSKARLITDLLPIGGVEENPSALHQSFNSEPNEEQMPWYDSPFRMTMAATQCF